MITDPINPTSYTDVYCDIAAGGSNRSLLVQRVQDEALTEWALDCPTLYGGPGVTAIVEIAEIPKTSGGIHLPDNFIGGNTANMMNLGIVRWVAPGYEMYLDRLVLIGWLQGSVLTLNVNGRDRIFVYLGSNQWMATLNSDDLRPTRFMRSAPLDYQILAMISNGDPLDAACIRPVGLRYLIQPLDRTETDSGVLLPNADLRNCMAKVLRSSPQVPNLDGCTIAFDVHVYRDIQSPTSGKAGMGLLDLPGLLMVLDFGDSSTH